MFLLLPFGSVPRQLWKFLIYIYWKLGTTASIQANKFQPCYKPSDVQIEHIVTTQSLWLAFLTKNTRQPSTAACQSQWAWVRDEVQLTVREDAIQVILYLLGYNLLWSKWLLTTEFPKTE